MRFCEQKMQRTEERTVFMTSLLEGTERLCPTLCVCTLSWLRGCAPVCSAGQRMRFCEQKMLKLREDMDTFRSMGRHQMVSASCAKPL